MATPLGKIATFCDKLWRSLRHTVWLQVLTILAIAVAINWRLLVAGGGCVVWGNYLLPCTQHQFEVYAPILSAWNPYSFMGAPVPIPLPFVLAQLTILNVIGLMAYAFGQAGAATVYAVLASVFVGWAFLMFSRPFVKNYWGRLAGAIFLVAGPFEFQLYGQGDYGPIISEGFVFLACYLLWLAVDRPASRWVFYPLSLAALLASLVMIQVFFLGLLLYIASLVAYTLVLQSIPVRRRLVMLGQLALRFLVLPLMLAPLILPALLSAPISLAPSSPYATPLTVFSAQSATPLAVFLTTAYVSTTGTALSNFVGYAMVSSTSNQLVADVWLGFIIAFVAVIWAGLALFRDRRGLYLLLVAVLGSLFGSGTTGPLGPLNSYLYLHLIGYQELNASYFWDWLVVVPALGLGLGILVERLIDLRKSQLSVPVDPPPPSKRNRLLSRLTSSRLYRFPPTRVAAVGLAIVVVGATAVPYAFNSQYGPIQGGLTGLQTTVYPADYSSIPKLLSQLVGSSYAGVAVFDPSLEWILNNSSSVTQNFFYYFPTVRTPSLPGYALPPYPGNFYAYWVYQEFYTNATPYVGQLLAVMGIEYLLVFYQTAPVPAYTLPFAVGQNASQLMRYQDGIVPVVTSKDFAIFENQYYANSAVSLTHLSLVVGGYSELNAMAYAGVNLTNQGAIFPSDIPAGACDHYLSLVSNIYAESTNALYGLALACTSLASSSPADDVTGDQAVTAGWANNYAATSGALGITYADSWPTPVAVTYGGPHVLNVPIRVGSCPSCNIWALVRLSSDGGSLSFQWSSEQWELETTVGWQGFNNSMVWVELPFQNVSGGGTLSVTATGGFNALGPVYVASSAALNSWLQQTLARTPVVLTTPGSVLTPPAVHQPGQTSGYCGLPVPGALNGKSLCLASEIEPLTLNITLPETGGGWLSLLVRSYSTAELTVGRSEPQLVGFTSWNQDVQAYPMAWLRIPVRPSELTTNNTLSVQVTGGVAFLSELVFSPQTTYGPFSPTVPTLDLSVSSTNLSRLVSGYHVAVVNRVGGVDEVEGYVQFQGAAYNWLVGTVTLNRTPSVPYDLAVNYTVSPGLVLGVDGIRLGGNGTTGLSGFQSALFSNVSVGARSTVTLEFYSNGNYSTGTVNASFTANVELTNLDLNANVSDVGPGPGWSVTEASTGYHLSGGPSSLVLVRVPFFPDLALSSGTGTLSGAFGAVDSVIASADNQTQFTVEPTSVATLNLGYAVLGLSAAAWVLVEFFWAYQRKRREKAAPSPGLEAAGQGPAENPPPKGPPDRS